MLPLSYQCECIYTHTHTYVPYMCTNNSTIRTHLQNQWKCCEPSEPYNKLVHIYMLLCPTQILTSVKGKLTEKTSAVQFLHTLTVIFTPPSDTDPLSRNVSIKYKNVAFAAASTPIISRSTIGGSAHLSTVILVEPARSAGPPHTISVQLFEVVQLYPDVVTIGQLVGEAKP